MLTKLAAATLLTALSWQAAAQTLPVASAPAMLEAGVLHHTLTDGFGNWQDVFVRGNLRTDSADLWNAELVHSKHFGANGTLFVLGNTHDFDARWYSNVSVSGSSGGFFLPNFRFDVTANRKWLAQSNFVTKLGLTSVRAKDGHEDRSLLLGATYYFQIPLVLEGGVHINRSNPGQVMSHNKFLALTYGRDKERIVSLVHSVGSEAYQYIGAQALLVDFDSHASTATWRQWLRPRQGFQLRAEAYHNPYYSRHGVELALFQEF